MNRKFYLLFLISSTITFADNQPVVNQVESKSELILLDRIESVVTTDKPAVITTSDVAKRAFDGQKYELKDLVNEVLLDDLAEKYKINVTDDDITRFLEKMKMSEEQIKAIAEANGYYNMQEFYDQLRKIHRANNALNFKVSSELVFTEDVIYEYNLANPKIDEAKYSLQIATVVDNGAKSESEVKNKVEHGVLEPAWTDPFDFEPAQVAESNKFIFDMKVGDVFVKPSTNGHFDCFKLVKFTPQKVYTIDERREEIVRLLQAQHYQETVEKIFKSLMRTALVIEPNFEKYPAPLYADSFANEKK